jgi:hypothetical protein
MDVVPPSECTVPSWTDLSSGLTALSVLQPLTLLHASPSLCGLVEGLAWPSSSVAEREKQNMQELTAFFGAGARVGGPGTSGLGFPGKAMVRSGVSEPDEGRRLIGAVFTSREAPVIKSVLPCCWRAGDVWAAGSRVACTQHAALARAGRRGRGGGCGVREDSCWGRRSRGEGR